MNDETATALLNWAHAITATVQQLSDKHDMPDFNLSREMRALVDAVQQSKEKSE